MVHYFALMDGGTAELAQLIGSRVRTRRLERGWTLDQLAERAGTSRRSVINVEQAAANPSVGILLRLSDALGIGLPALVAPPDQVSVRLTRAGEAAPLWSGPAGGRGLLVAGTGGPDVVELWDWTLAPGEEHRSDSHAAGTQELLQVRSGRLTLEAGGQRLDLGPDDAVAFPGDLPHAYSNPGEANVRFTLTVFEPGVGAGPIRSESHA